MRADYDREANPISIALADEPKIEEPLEAAAPAYGLDLEALLAGVRAALSAPDRSVTLTSTYVQAA